MIMLMDSESGEYREATQKEIDEFWKGCEYPLNYKETEK